MSTTHYFETKGTHSNVALFGMLWTAQMSTREVATTGKKAGGSTLRGRNMNTLTKKSGQQVKPTKRGSDRLFTF